MSAEEKGLYVISIVSEMLDLHPQTLRMYERFGLIQPSRTDGQTRLYSETDIEQLQYVTDLTKNKAVNKAGVQIILEMKQELDLYKRRVMELEAELEAERSKRHNGTGTDSEQRKNFMQGSVQEVKQRQRIKINID